MDRRTTLTTIVYLDDEITNWNFRSKMATTPNLDGVKWTLSSFFFIYFYFYFWINILWSINLSFELFSGYSGWHGRCANFIGEDANKSNNFILYIVLFVCYFLFNRMFLSSSYSKETAWFFINSVTVMGMESVEIWLNFYFKDSPWRHRKCYSLRKGIKGSNIVR